MGYPLGVISNVVSKINLPVITTPAETANPWDPRFVFAPIRPPTPYVPPQATMAAQPNVNFLAMFGGYAPPSITPFTPFSFTSNIF